MEWSAKARIVAVRKPAWDMLVNLSAHTQDDSDFSVILSEIEAIRTDRLLFHEPDPVQPLLNNVTLKLNALLNHKKELYNALFDAKMAELQANPYFLKLAPEQKHTILSANQLLAKPEIKNLDSQALLNVLNKMSLSIWDTKIAALPGQFQASLDAAILLSAPQAATYNLPRTTLNSIADIDKYVSDLKSKLQSLLNESGSVILK